MSQDEIKSILEDVTKYLNDNYGPFKGHPKGVVKFPYTDKVVFVCWECGAIVYIDRGIYYIAEDDGYWYIEKSVLEFGREEFGYKSGGYSIGWAKDIADALITLNSYIIDKGKPVYYEGIEPPRICHYIL